MPEPLTPQIQGALSVYEKNLKKFVCSTWKWHSALNFINCRPHKRIAFFPIYYTGHSEAAYGSLADYDVTHKKLHWTESVSARKHSVSGKQSNDACKLQWNNIRYLATQVEGGVHASHTDGHRVSFQKKKAVELKQDTRTGLSCSEYFTNLPRSTSDNGNASEMYFRKVKEAGQVCSGTRVAASNVQQEMMDFFLCFTMWPQDVTHRTVADAKTDLFFLTSRACNK